MTGYRHEIHNKNARPAQDVSFRHAFSISGLTCSAFRGFQNVQELHCSAGALGPGASVLFMSLYRVKGDTLLASVNVGSRECITVRSFSSCVIDPSDSRKTLLKTLIVNPDYDRAEVTYGCNVTVVVSGRRANDVSWIVPGCVARK